MKKCLMMKNYNTKIHLIFNVLIIVFGDQLKPDANLTVFNIYALYLFFFF